MGNVIISHNQRKDNMTTHKTFYITYYARTHNGIKLEKRIFLLEKFLASHAKCIGRLAHEKENKDEHTNV